MTYASHARVITRIIQANLIHLSIKMTTPHPSRAPFVGERVFQNRGVCGQASPSFPSPTPFLPPFCSRPIFRASRMRNTNTRGPYFVRFARERLLRRLLVGSQKLPFQGFEFPLSNFLSLRLILRGIKRSQGQQSKVLRPIALQLLNLFYYLLNVQNTGQ